MFKKTVKCNQCRFLNSYFVIWNKSTLCLHPLYIWGYNNNRFNKTNIIITYKQPLACEHSIYHVKINNRI